MSARDDNMYQLTEERQKELWADCTFVFDTSALLALYLYPEEVRQRIYKEIFEKVKGRLWIPGHVLFEFLKNKASKIREPVSRSYKPLNEDYIKPIVEAFHKSLNRVDALKNVLRNTDTHPHLVSEDIELYERKLKDFIQTTVDFGNTFNEQTEQKISEILQLEQHDTVYEQVQRYFEVGTEYTHDEIMKITLEGKHRYEFKIPPGYEDLKDKIGTQIFGDLIIWKQVLDYSKKEKKNIVFVCNDLKEDWWHLVSDKKGDRKRTQGPRKELIKELKDHSGSAFWMYNQARFIDIANTLIGSNVPNRYIEQISKFATSGTLDKWLAYTCNNCQATNTVDTSTLSLNFEAVGTVNGEDQYQAAAELSCTHCSNPVHAVFNVSEYPAGVIRHRKVSLRGAALIDTSQLEDYLDEGFNTGLEAVEEEITVIDKKQLRLKAGITRKIRFPKAVEGPATLFEIKFIPSKQQDPARRLFLEAYNRQKGKLAKTLVLENGISRFVLRSAEEHFPEEFIYVELTADRDLTITLSVTEYPGTGRYLEKLIY